MMFNPNQGGFRKNKSTISTSADFTDDIGVGLNLNEYTLASFVDLQKAFDTVNHDNLINKLYDLGLHNNTGLWLIDYEGIESNFVLQTTYNQVLGPSLVGFLRARFSVQCCSYYK